MKNYAQINSEKIVTQVLVVGDDKDESWLESRLGGDWIESTRNGKNAASVGFTFDAELNTFIPPKPDGDYYWDEETTSWVEFTPEAE